jgi:phage terminase large subunit
MTTEAAKPLDGLFALNPVQRAFVMCPDKVSAYYGGIGNGKTLAGAVRALMLSDLYPGNIGLVGRLTYPELRDTTQKQVLDIVRARNGGSLEPGPYVKSWNQTSGTLELKTGDSTSTILFRYLENEESILNLNLGWFFIDQAEFVKEGIFAHLLGRLRWWSQERAEAFKAKYQRTPRHYAFIVGNPAPGWVYRRFKQRKTEDGKPLNYTMYEAPTSANKDHLPKGYIEGLQASYPDAWVKRYLEGDWSTFSGQVYKEFERRLHCVQPFNIPHHWPRFIGWDHGTVNPTAVSFQAVDEQGFVVLYKEYYRPSLILKEHAEAVHELAEGDPVPRSDDGRSIVVYMDPSVKGDSNMEGRDARQLYLDYGIVGVPANNNVRAGIERVSMMLHPDPLRSFPDWHPRGCKKDRAGRIIKEADKGAPGVFIFESCSAHLHELELYRYKERPMGELLNAYEDPVKYMDHAMDAWRYGTMAIFEQAKPLVQPKTPMRRPTTSFRDFAHRKLVDMDLNA